MSTLNSRILERVRLDLGDLPQPFDFQFVTDGQRDHYRLENRPINPDSLMILRNGAVQVDPGFSGIVVDPTAGVLVFTAAVPPAGEVWEVEGQKWRYFSDYDLQIFIDTAMAEHTYSRGDSSGSEFTSADVKPVEEYPIALRAVVMALWALATDASFDIDILAPDGVNIPRSERHRQLMEMIGARQTQYDELAHALNIGVNRIEVFTARRVAKLTNRLVPVYLPKEWDDHTRPKRVLFPPMLQGSEPVKSGIASYDHHIVSGDPYSVTLEFAFDLTGCVIENAIRSGLMSSQTGSWGPPVMKFTQEVLDERRLKLSLTGAESRRIPYNCYWEMQIKKPEEAESRSKLRGMVRATNNEIVR